ncbi:hypothetical protein ACFX13_036196 [Malus domestica]
MATKLKFIILGHCWTGLSSIRAATGGLRSSSLLDKGK